MICKHVLRLFVRVVFPLVRVRRKRAKLSDIKWLKTITDSDSKPQIRRVRVAISNRGLKGFVILRRRDGPPSGATPSLLFEPLDAASAVQHELLDAPIQQFGDVEHVFRGARHLVNPAELFQPFAGLAEHAQ